MGTATLQQKLRMTQLLREAILRLCSSHRPYDGALEIDGIICITGQCEGQELVVKVHEKLALDLSTAGLDSNDNIDPTFKMRENFGADLSHGYPSDDENHSPSSEPDLAIDMRAGAHNNNSGHNNSLMDVDDKSDHNSTIASVDSPPDGDSSHMGPRGLYLGKLPYLTPTILQKKLPLRSDRWTPGTPLPTTPECKHCGYTFATFDVLSEHNETVHSVFTCQYCYKTFTSRSNLERHSRLHTGLRPYVCSLCGKAFSRKDHLTNHATKHAFKCGTCLKRYPDKKQLSSHYTSEHGMPLTQVCEFCNKGFGTAVSYEEHVRTHPQYHATRKGRSLPAPGGVSGSRRHLCRLCQFSCNDRITLIKHKMMHGDNQRCFTCLSCAKMFSNPLQYSNHLYTHGSETNIFECCMCRQIYPTLDALKKHELVHLSENHYATDLNSNYYSCPECSKVFQSEANLQEHMEIHESVNSKFRCAVCSQSFTTYTDLWKHTEDLKHYAVAQPADQATDGENNYIQVNEQDQAAYPDVETDSQKADQAEEHLDDSDVEVVEPRAPEDDEAANDEPVAEPERSYDESRFVITENPTAVIEVTEDEDTRITMMPVKSLLTSPVTSSRSSRKQGRPQRLREILPKPQSEIVSRLILDVPQVSTLPGRQQHLKSEMGSTAMASSTRSGTQTKVLSTSTASVSAATVPYIEIKPTEEPSIPAASAGTAHERTTSPVPSTSAGTSPIKAAVANIEMPPGPASCLLCSQIFNTFQEMEAHCLNEHSRSPCLFCNKTFAQKANRDRHLCLHTGDKPYSCPECDEKFSRGDKLKIHRTKVHNYIYPPSNRVKGEGKDWSTSPSPSTTQERSSVSPAPAANSEEKVEDWSTRNNFVSPLGSRVKSEGKDRSGSPSSAAIIERNSVSPSAGSTEDRWNATSSAHETVSATGEWTLA